MTDEHDPGPVYSPDDPRIAELFADLDAAGITHRTIEHEPLHSVEDAALARRRLDGIATKNLFLRDKRGRMFLLTARAEQDIDLLAIRPQLGARGRLSFASDERLARVLGVRPGSVSLLAAIAASPDEVTLVVDRTILDDEWILQHPLHNRATTQLRTADLFGLLSRCGHEVRWIDFAPID